MIGCVLISIITLENGINILFKKAPGKAEDHIHSVILGLFFKVNNLRKAKIENITPDKKGTFVFFTGILTTLTFLTRGKVSFLLEEITRNASLKYLAIWYTIMLSASPTPLTNPLTYTKE